MKNFNRLFGGLILAFGLVAVVSLAQPVQASIVARSPKEVFLSSYTTGVVLVSPAISTNAVANAAFMPGAVYQLILSSGAAGEYFQLYDSTSTAGITCGALSNGAQQLNIGRFLFSSTTANVNFTFDPPIVFHNGLAVCDSAATGQAILTYELGRGLSGN